MGLFDRLFRKKKPEPKPNKNWPVRNMDYVESYDSYKRRRNDDYVPISESVSMAPGIDMGANIHEHKASHFHGFGGGDFGGSGASSDYSSPDTSSYDSGSSDCGSSDCGSCD